MTSWVRRFLSMKGQSEMSISLFPHNQTAYEALLTTLETERRACIIHPTGTGKSFIGFKYCEDHPEKAVLWLSPSEYIFKTQCESLTATGTEMPENISFMTYAKLSILEQAEPDVLHPDVVILDEMHRAAAPTWEKPVQTLLSQNPVVIGLTATHIRYLDGQKDTTETFNMNVASEMTLGEAIALGILNPPRYVLSVYSYQNELEAYAKRIRRARNTAVRDAANEVFEALRRAIEKADGLDDIFSRHMTERHGKYLVFCSHVEHLDEMMSKVPEWFAKVDDRPHVYRAYADDPGTSKAFAAFKADQSEHLKLLFCIDMLNEGIHVDNVDGVILLRPTISPIIYKQQIGRALAAGKKRDAVIFDVVNNIENLYAIDAVQQEIKLAISYYRSLGEGEEIVNDNFQIIDEVGNVRKLFERLNDTLTASWDIMYSHAAAYYRENGNLEIPRLYKTPEGYSLGRWLETQRRVYNSEQYGNLDEDRIRKLEEIGMVWDNIRDQSWNRFYTAAAAYYQENGDLRVPSSYVTPSGLRLGTWIANQRSNRKSCIHMTNLTPERIEALDRIGMIWDVPDYLWVQYYALAAQYHREHGNLLVPNRYVTADGVRLGQWIAALRLAYCETRYGYRLSEDQIRQMNELDMVWNPFEERWNSAYEHANAFYRTHAHLNIPATYKCEDGFSLGKWLDHQREYYASGKLSPERAEKLNALGVVWEKADPWEQRYALAKEYFEEHGNLHVPPKYRADGIWLAKWLNGQRQIYIGNRPGKRLTEDQIRRLDEIGMEWRNRSLLNKMHAWEEQYAEAKRFYEKNGNLSVPGDYRSESGKCLSIWILRQREANRKGKLSEKQRELLDEIGMEWELDPWEKGYAHAEQYHRENGNLNIPTGYKSEDGYKLGRWLANQKANLKSDDSYRRVSPEQKKRLDALGIIWDNHQAAWEEGFRHAAPYLKELNGAAWKTNYVSPDGYKTGSWLRGQIRTEQKGRLTPEKRKLLEEIGLRFVQKEEVKPAQHRDRAFERNAVSGSQEVRQTGRVT